VTTEVVSAVAGDVVVTRSVIELAAEVAVVAAAVGVAVVAP